MTPATGWKGLYQVLATNISTCRKLHIKSELPCKHVPNLHSAFDLMLNPNPQSELCYQGIDEVFINAWPLPCLVPPNITCTFPNLKSISVDCNRAIQFADPQPLPFCSTLQSMSYTARGNAQPLPSKYHSPEELKRQLPNINVLNLDACIHDKTSLQRRLQCFNNMLLAWGGQLTELKYGITCGSVGAVTVNLQHCTRLQSLRWSVCTPQHSIYKLPKSLTCLLLSRDIRESDLNIILTLPLLKTLNIDGKFSASLQQDWSNHPYRLQQFSIYEIPLVDLAKLPLNSLSGTGCLKIMMSPPFT